LYWKTARRFINTTFHEIIISGSRVLRWGQTNIHTGGGYDWHIHTQAGRQADVADLTYACTHKQADRNDGANWSIYTQTGRKK
jgi:chromosome condensin MukBEF complex kleisin-like MukF subunit